MANTLATQVSFLLSGCRKNDGSINANGKIYFFEPGGTTNRAIYNAKAQSGNAYDTKTAIVTDPHDTKEYVLLDANGFPNAEAGGLAEVYADGNYDIYVYDSSAGAGGTPEYTISSYSSFLEHDHSNAINGGSTLDTPTLTTPTIADFTNATHDHVTNAGGGLVMKFEEKRSQFTHVDDENITISAGQYYCKDKFCWWDAQLTSTDVAAATSDIVYLYLDYSAITSGTEITNAELIWSTTEPTWSEPYRALMNGDDRCIFSVLTDATDDILEFIHADNLVVYADDIATTEGSQTPSDTFTDYTLDIPSFSTHALLASKLTRVDAVNTELFWRTNGQTGSVGHAFGCFVNANIVQQTQTGIIITDSSGKVEFKVADAAANHTVEIWTQGWYFPIGM